MPHDDPRAIWRGKKLWQETIVRDLRIEDVDGELGIEACYEASLMPDDFLLSLNGPTAIDPQLPGCERGGMLHHFRVQPISRHDLTAQCQTVREEIMSKLAAASRRPVQRNGRWLGIYEGKVLVPKSGGPVLAWATWTRSALNRPAKRTYANDEALADLVDTINSIRLFDGMNPSDYLVDASKTLLFDTVNGVVPGAASILFAKLTRPWMKQGYTRILLYRHKILQLAQAGLHLGAGIVVPRGNNEQSEKFFKSRGIHDIGTLLSNVYAVRQNPKTKGVYLVLSTLAYMLGELAEVDALSKKLNDERFERFLGTK